MEETNKTPKQDLMNAALKHYEEAANAIHHWNSDIPKAIRLYYTEVPHQPVTAKTEQETILLRDKNDTERIALMKKYGITEADVTEFINGFKAQEVSDEDIEKWANKVVYDNKISSRYGKTLLYGLKSGAKAMRDGKIKAHRDNLIKKGE